MKRYGKMKDSGVEWIGDVPVNWIISKYKYHINIFNGYPFKSENFNSEKGTPIIRIRDITSGTTKTFYESALNYPRF